MTIVAHKPIVGTAGKLIIVAPALDQVLITTADSTSYEVTDDDGDALSPSISGTLSYVSSLPVEGLEIYGGWFANIIWPSEPQRVHVHMSLTKDSAPQKWHTVVEVVDFN